MIQLGDVDLGSMGADLRDWWYVVEARLGRLGDDEEVDDGDVEHAEGDEDGTADEEGGGHVGCGGEEEGAVAVVAVDVP